MNSESMNEFMIKGGTYGMHCRAMLYHTFLVVMLGSTVLAKSVEEEVWSNDYHILFCRDHLERYTPQQIGEIMFEGIGTDGDVSMERVTLLYKAIVPKNILHSSIRRQEARCINVQMQPRTCVE